MRCRWRRRSRWPANSSRANRYDQALDLFDRIPRRRAGGAGHAAARAVQLAQLHDNSSTRRTDVKLDDPSLMLLRARAAWRADQPQEFLAGLDAVEKQFPAQQGSVGSEDRCARSTTRPTSSTTHSASTISRRPSTPAPSATTARISGPSAGRTRSWGKYDDALQTFDRYIRSYPDGDWKTNSLFWSAKIHDKLRPHAERDAKVAADRRRVSVQLLRYRARRAAGAAAGDRPRSANNDRSRTSKRSSQRSSEPRFDVVHELQGSA